MMTIRIAFLAVGAAFLGSSDVPLPGRLLSLEERVEAQRAIERVHYRHQIGATLPFELAVTDEILEKKVATYLKESAALEELWSITVSAEMLRAEIERMARNSRMPDRLLELYRALGDDPLLIQECLARPALVDRLARSRFSSDSLIHGSARLQAERLRERLVAHDPTLSIDYPDPVILEPLSRPPGAPSEPEKRTGNRLGLEPAEFARQRSLASDTPGEPGPVVDDGERFVIRVAHGAAGAQRSITVYEVPKATWDEWWRGIEPTLDAAWAETVADPGAELILPPPSGPALQAACAGETRWTDDLVGGVPSPRDLHTAVWTGSRMIIWGGTGAGSTGALYDPAVDAWIGISSVGAPSPRILHTAVWTGALMLIWGGGDDVIGADDAGARYDPLSDAWTPISSTGAPSPRTRHTAVWTGTEMIVWGGLVDSGAAASGGRYDPETDTWSPVSESGAPSYREGHVAVWTGSVMVIWGGSGGGSTGGRYDPGSDTWQPTSLVDAPSPRQFFEAVWTGKVMVVWGGVDGATPTWLASGGRYDPGTDTWSATSMTNAPAARFRHSAVWTGNRMIVWGGHQAFTSFDTGGLYNPTNDTWGSTSLAGAPQARRDHTAVWTGSQMIIWGGRDGGNGAAYDTGARYAPSGSGAWTPTSLGALTPRNRHTAVWTGSEMIVWGGSGGGALPTNTGSRYDPATDTWRATALAGAPTARHGHVSVWTGTRMVVWGGQNDSGAPVFLNTGGRYNPVTDTWQSTTTTGAPFNGTGQTWFSAVWTGSRMIVWGFLWTGTNMITNVGGRYDPAADSWAPVSLAGAPPVRGYFTAVWTGSRMVVWGGADPTRFPSPRFATGGRYDPVSDSWAAMTLGPAGRAGHSAVWTGTRMIIWGGSDFNDNLVSSGFRYDPVVDTWATVPTTDAPSVRFRHSAVWTGEEMIVWGGWTGTPADRTGGRYNPTRDDWAPTPVQGAPSAPNTHTAVWTGSSMIIWGINGVGGGVLLADSSPDADQDGYRVCSGDCDDARASVRPGAPEVCDGLANDCASPSWPAPPGVDRDDDGDGFSECRSDCDDAQATAFPGAVEVCDQVDNDCDVSVDEGFDQDLDQWSTCAGDCDDARASVRPGAPQTCDGLNNDCSSPSWPALAGTNEDDSDGDSFAECGGDCNDTSPQTYPGAMEINDGEDNQCPDEPGAGSIDELSGEAGFESASSQDLFCWTIQAGATSYETIRAGEAMLFDGCHLEQTSSTCWSDPVSPPPGGAQYYLVRARLPHLGSWGTTSWGLERSYACAGD